MHSASLRAEYLDHDALMPHFLSCPHESRRAGGTQSTRILLKLPWRLLDVLALGGVRSGPSSRRQNKKLLLTLLWRVTADANEKVRDEALLLAFASLLAQQQAVPFALAGGRLR